MVRPIPRFKVGDEILYLTGSSGWLPGTVMNIFPSWAYQGFEMKCIGHFYQVDAIVRLFHSSELRLRVTK